MLLIGLKDGQAEGDFEKEYLGGRAKELADSANVTKYVANIVRQPTQEMIDAGWGWGGKDESGILGIDEVWYPDDFDVLSLYKGHNVIGAYECNEIPIRTCVAQWPVGTKSHWVKRMGLLKCFDEQRPEDFHQYWMHIHARKALKNHLGAGMYFQNHFIKTLKAAPTVWNGSMSLDYWNIDSFQYGHFSQPDSRAIIAEDGSHFMDIFLAIYVEEYVMKRPEGEEFAKAIEP